ncbi:hypothetical protein CLV25_11576 [Acetobacteroides hydrogenigenes]|uniref:Uncharacterized protein n=1 Tax=Acetobacteroides hydrogenigenes TaxID=979970 RepID=A0A4R2E9X2_9BACT|nr:hypothetical protein CLV25_11576 [Acetobacteroides hydrogenigenes]
MIQSPIELPTLLLWQFPWQGNAQPVYFDDFPNRGGIGLTASLIILLHNFKSYICDAAARAISNNGNS